MHNSITFILENQVQTFYPQIPAESSFPEVGRGPEQQHRRAGGRSGCGRAGERWRGGQEATYIGATGEPAVGLGGEQTKTNYRRQIQIQMRIFACRSRGGYPRKTGSTGTTGSARSSSRPHRLRLCARVGRWPSGTPSSPRTSSTPPSSRSGESSLQV